jgi:methyl-accepting chemotaxis protein
VQQVADKVSKGSAEQVHWIQQVSDAIGRMGTVSQNTAAMAEESAAAGEQLSSHAKELEAIVEGLNAIIGGAGAKAGDGPTISNSSTDAQAVPVSHPL